MADAAVVICSAGAPASLRLPMMMTSAGCSAIVAGTWVAKVALPVGPPLRYPVRGAVSLITRQCRCAPSSCGQPAAPTPPRAVPPVVESPMATTVVPVGSEPRGLCVAAVAAGAGTVGWLTPAGVAARLAAKEASKEASARASSGEIRGALAHEVTGARRAAAQPARRAGRSIGG